MRKPLTDTLIKKLQLKESWVVFFILGLVMMNYPFIHIFNKAQKVSGVPLLFLYLVVGWLCSILVIYLFTKAMGTFHDEPPSGGNR